MILGAFLGVLSLSYFYIRTGIGSIQTKRWAWSLTLVFSWILLIFVIYSFLLSILVFEGIFDSKFTKSIFPVTSSNFMNFIIPAAFVFYYSLDDVRITCEVRNYQPSWIDNCPLPVLGATIVFILHELFIIYILHGIIMAFSGQAGFVYSWFGQIVTGWGALIAVVITTCLAFVLARGVFMRNIFAWWGAILLKIISGIAIVLTMLKIDIHTVAFSRYLKEVPVEEIDPFFSMFNDPIIIGNVILIYIAVITYLVYVKKYYKVNQ
jgi:hypothetical protein